MKWHYVMQVLTQGNVVQVCNNSLFKSIYCQLRHNQGSTQWSPEPFRHEMVESGQCTQDYWRIQWCTGSLLQGTTHLVTHRLWFNLQSSPSNSCPHSITLGDLEVKSLVTLGILCAGLVCYVRNTKEAIVHVHLIVATCCLRWCPTAFHLLYDPKPDCWLSTHETCGRCDKVVFPTFFRMDWWQHQHWCTVQKYAYTFETILCCSSSSVSHGDRLIPRPLMLGPGHGTDSDALVCVIRLDLLFHIITRFLCHYCLPSNDTPTC